MADGNASPVRLGRANSTGAGYQDLFLEKFSGRVNLNFERNTPVRDVSTVITTEWGKSVNLSEIGDAFSASHTPGNMLNGLEIPQGERVVTPDSMIVSHTFIADWDRFQNHFEVQDRFAQKMGQALANRYERDILRVAIKAATESTPTDALTKAGNTEASTGLTPKTSAAHLITVGMRAAQKLDERDVPDNNDRALIVAPEQYWLLVATGTEIINQDYNEPGNGSMARGFVTRLGNLKVVKSNNFADILNTATQVESTGASSTENSPTQFQVNTTTTDTIALVMTPETVVTAEWLGIQSDAKYQLERLGHLLVSRMMVGHGVGRPETAVNIEGYSHT